jgi:N-acetylneuraminic acid mutarotase
MGFIAVGEWLKYTVKVSTSAYYQIDARVASGSKGGTFHISCDDVDKTGQLTLPNTNNNWQAWTTVTKKDVYLTAGTHVMKLSIDRAFDYYGVGNVDWINVTQQTSSAPQQFSWKQVASNPLARFEAAGAAVNGKLYVFGGYINPQIQATARADVYNPATNIWARIADMPEPLTHCGQVVDGSTIWLIGGFVGNHPGQGTIHVWKYDTVNNRWSAGPSLPEQRGAGAAARVGRTIHIFGGLLRAQSSANPVTVDQGEHWALNLDNQSAGWQIAAPMINPRNHLAGIGLNGKVYAIGGQHLWDEETGAQSEVDVYDPATDRWTQVASMPLPRSHTSASTFIRSGLLFVVGGATNDFTSLRDVISYNPATNRWSSHTPLPYARLTPVAADIAGKLVVSTGSAEDNVPQAKTWIGTPI